MTEEEWFGCDEPQWMLEFLRSLASKRKLRLFACACCSRMMPLLDDERSKGAIEIAERHADGLANDEDLIAAETVAEQAFLAVPWGPNSRETPAKLRASAAWGVVTTNLEETVFAGLPTVGFAISTAIQIADASEDPATERIVQARLLRDIFGNSFRPVAVDPSWLTSTVTALARGIYADRAFDRLPILADALQDAGCDNADVLDHCRGPGPHVRGCRVVDLILGKA